MNKAFKGIFEELQAQRESVLARVKQAPTEILNLSPAPGKWSISQILTHLLTSERLSVGYMKKKSRGIEQVGNSGFVESLRLSLLIFSQRFPIKYKAPEVVVLNTPEPMPLDELINQWNRIRDELAAFLENMDDKNIRKIIYKHPIAGRLDARQAMIFFREHISHHTPQINRILNTPYK